jgi:hypothetical protein
MTDPDSLTERDIHVIHAVLRAAVDGPFFPDWEFGTLMGVTRGEVRVVAEHWPTIAPGSSTVNASVHGALANLLGYPHHEWEAWAAFSDAGEQELEQVLHRWRRYVRASDWATHDVESGHEPVPVLPPISNMDVYFNIRSELAHWERRFGEGAGTEGVKPLNVNQLILSWHRAGRDFGSWNRATLDLYAELLATRDQIERFLEVAGFETRAYLDALVGPIDDAYRQTTREGRDLVERIGGLHPGWWWHRVPLRPGAELRRAMAISDQPS